MGGFGFANPKVEPIVAGEGVGGFESGFFVDVEIAILVGGQERLNFLADFIALNFDNEVGAELLNRLDKAFEHVGVLAFGVNFDKIERSQLALLDKSIEGGHLNLMDNGLTLLVILVMLHAKGRRIGIALATLRHIEFGRANKIGHGSVQDFDIKLIEANVVLQHPIKVGQRLEGKDLGGRINGLGNEGIESGVGSDVENGVGDLAGFLP